MHIFLYGPSGSGKSTVGKLLSRALNLPFFDLDAEIEDAAGQSIPQMITGQGESAFRDAETIELQKVIFGANKIIALGGGTLLQDENRSLAETAGQVVLLVVDLPTLVERLSQDENERPLLAGELEDRLADLLECRREHYASFPLGVDASQAPEQVAWDIQRLMGRYHLRGMGAGYDVIVQEGGIDQLGDMLKSRALGGPVLVISDMNVAQHYAGRVMKSLQATGYTASQLVILAGEAHKNLETVASLWRGCLEAGLDRKSTIIALGGGVVGDLAGFAAATFMRGCNWVAVPTTLLAMVDASLGGKTGFDLPEGKNLVGAFYPPRLVLADPDVLSTLPERELRAGLAEVVKHGVIADPGLFELCTQGWETAIARLPEVVRRGMAVKVKVIEEDPYERGIRAALNLGHTIGHAVELVSGFSLLHGEAVAIGMVAEARLAERLAVASPGLPDAIAESLIRLGLPVEIPEILDRAELIRAMRVDKKKTAGVVRFALPVRIGEVKVGVEIKDLEKTL
ncbi:MAG: 3-dehydroquinate synthase [Anaerolineales bacterium]|nr:3-dehydroquinate synthase [Anaerolineales bacterium]